MNRRWLIAVLLLPCLLLCACAPKETVSPYADIPKPTAVITMENGSTMTFTLDPASAPNTVSNFISLANAGFYDGMKIDYVYPTYFLRSGDPNGDGTGGPGYTIDGEFSENAQQAVPRARRDLDVPSGGRLSLRRKPVFHHAVYPSGIRRKVRRVRLD